MSSTYHTTEGIVLKKMPHGEADFLVLILTRNFGKLDFRARGARKHTSKLNPHLDFLNLINFSFVKNGDAVPTLIDVSVEKINNFDFECFPIISKVAKTIDCIIPHEICDKTLFLLVEDYLFSENFSEDKSTELVKNVFLHEGYGKNIFESFLPEETKAGIIELWPLLRN